MDKEMMAKVNEFLKENGKKELNLDELDGITGGSCIDGAYPTPDIEEVKQMALLIYETFGLETAISYATTLLGCSSEEVKSWFSV